MNYKEALEALKNGYCIKDSEGKCYYYRDKSIWKGGILSELDKNLTYTLRVVDKKDTLCQITH